jgi:hypothetical protein
MHLCIWGLELICSFSDRRPRTSGVLHSHSALFVRHHDLQLRTELAKDGSVQSSIRYSHCAPWLRATWHFEADLQDLTQVKY